MIDTGIEYATAGNLRLVSLASPPNRYDHLISDLDGGHQRLIREWYEHTVKVVGDTDRPVVAGFCPVCGCWAHFVGAPPLRESFVCQSCFSTARYRRMALGVLRAICEMTGVNAPSLEHLPTSHPTSFRLLDTQPAFASPPYACYSLPERLARVPWIEVNTSAYRPSVPWGEDLGGTTTNQNLECLTFADDHFDLVMTSDVMEHVRLYHAAHSEIARVVRPGGVYIFTVPHSRGLSENLVRIAVHNPDDPSLDEFVLPPEYHGSADPDEGPVLSFRVFGTNIDEELAAVGLDVEYSYEPDTLHAVFDTELFYCRRR